MRWLRLFVICGACPCSSGEPVFSAYSFTYKKRKERKPFTTLNTSLRLAPAVRPVAWPKYRFRSGPPQILIGKFRGAAANFEVDFDCQNASVMPQDRAYRRRTPTHDIPPLNRTRSPPQSPDTANARGTAVLAQAIALRSPATDRAHLPALVPIISSAGGRRMTQLL